MNHIELVFNTSIEIANDDSIKLLSAADFAILINACLLHDAGLHLTKDGFYSLIDKNCIWKPLPHFNESPWHDLWISFLAEARRFNDKTLESLFGTNFKPVESFPNSSEVWSEFDYLLAGEFIRRHHARLAHEIAIYGIPSTNGTTFKIFNAEESDDIFFAIELSGLVARSHGIPLRDTFKYLEKRFHGRIETRSAHPVFLMALLRIADYLQIQSERAPTARTKMATMRSPISAREWLVHQCVEDISNVSDPESVDIKAKPTDVEAYLRLQHWVTGLQQELDQTWAVLGEVFGLQSHNKLNKLGLRFRRVKSNIDDTYDFERESDFVPQRINFTTSESELLKLLVGPLYSNDIMVGIREIVQNALDAVRELNLLVDAGEIPAPTMQWQTDYDVKVEFLNSDEDNCVGKIVISDRGVGMTLLTLRDYFLKAGASFRKSDAWKRQYEDGEGRSRVQRTGRFGVGALAAFLLGNRISVETRHYSAPVGRGLSFTATMDTDAINITYLDCPVGTRISVDIPKHVGKNISDSLPNLSWRKLSYTLPISSYFGRKPSLAYSMGGETLDIDSSLILPSLNFTIDDIWHKVCIEHFTIFWNYIGSGVPISVNNVIINDKKGNYRNYMDSDEFLFSDPNIEVVDFSGHFPLNLQRNELASRSFPFAKELLEDVVDDFIVSTINSLIEDPSIIPDYPGIRTAYSYRYSDRRTWLYCSDGLVLNRSSFLKKYNLNFAICNCGISDETAIDYSLIEFSKALSLRCIATSVFSPSIAYAGFKSKGDLLELIRGSGNEFIRHHTESLNCYVPAKILDKIMSEFRPGREAKGILSEFSAESGDYWKAISGSLSFDTLFVDSLKKHLFAENEKFNAFTLNKITISDKDEEVQSIILDRWMKLVGVPYIPVEINKLKNLRRRLREKLSSTKYENIMRIRKINS
ncbi:ATP-binding protein [Bosea sp. Root381]|uniref:HD domain-containing protein n=1 Tax=Bosea sp. Root381 TaxID=1736524 RepID=UPI00138F8E94|nr:ATP-binding protein [Bosea sp. Root381]